MKKEWEKSEHRAAQFLKHEVVRGSGRGARKSDNVGVLRRGEHKSTEKSTFRLTAAHLQKIKKEALLSGREPVFTIETPEYFYECVPYYGDESPTIIVKNSFVTNITEPLRIQIGAEVWTITPHLRKLSLFQK